ncbi:cytochrome P450 [Actinomadura craniellae]|uniref:Cytochrome P450 n=1 Tax=Actinomadura craniellae TaxID=2231787 RepID=A0A365GX04_9ACTN|nr:cytochrome P450 [Actinomadura craniellae]RAY11359.1 cytochrome P450 [Actinomadura craniellae]
MDFIPYPTRRTPFHPPAEYAALRQGPPVRVTLAGGASHWLVSRYEDVREVLAGPSFSADDQHPNYARLLPLPTPPGMLSFLRMDDPEHNRQRRMLTSEFTVRRVNAMRPGIQQITDRLLDELAEHGPPADLIERFALPLPSLVICQLLGVPYEDHDFFQVNSHDAISTAVTPERAGEAMGALAEYMDRLTAEKERNPGDDLLSRVAAAQVATGRLDHDELVSMARLLLLAGHETTANMLGLGTLLLLRHPDQLAALRADPSLVRPAVEELLRHTSIVHEGLSRVATEEVVLGGVTIPAGDAVIINIPSANRDERRFADPDTFDIGRGDRHHIAFGFGAHQCIGQTLARVEMEIAFTAMLERFPGLALACDVEEIPFRYESVVYGVGALPVTW